MDSRGITTLLLLGAIFGILGGAVAFMRAYDGYSHFPAISKRKKLMMSLEYAGVAFVFIIGIIIIFLILYDKGMI
ncbi:MAG: hypothetical protein A2176_04365 [Spirochaetes bacterium RBG_13_51_14]|nr:MAG: hypothetical protein A2176_04365 [Spirochaetes bacterium RBG_13_51_14]